MHTRILCILIMYEDEGVETSTALEQIETEASVVLRMRKWKHGDRILKEAHLNYLYTSSSGLSSHYEGLDASKPWLVYWTLHAMDLLGSLEEVERNRLSPSITDTLHRCAGVEGGYGGGYLQIPHLAPTYSAVNSLCIVGTEEALSSIDRVGVSEFLHEMKDPTTGGFSLHKHGEQDMRGLYCAICTAYLLNVLDNYLVDRTVSYIKKCQTYEGGFGSCPGTEAHGGYTFCAVATLTILNKLHMIDVDRVIHWAAQRQMKLEGGFQGRTNKLVDSCYSFWVGSLFNLLKVTVCDCSKLVHYVLSACQTTQGGLRDKPGKSRDMYHTCYSLSGLSTVAGLDGLNEVDPCCNISIRAMLNAKQYFSEKIST